MDYSVEETASRGWVANDIAAYSERSKESMTVVLLPVMAEAVISCHLEVAKQVGDWAAGAAL